MGPTQVVIDVVDLDGDLDERAGRQLRKELLDLDVEEVRATERGRAPDGSKAGGVVDWTQLIVTLSAANGVVPLLVSMVKDWVGRRAHGPRRYKVALTIDGDSLELDGADDEQAAALVDAFIARHGGSRDEDGSDDG